VVGERKVETAALERGRRAFSARGWRAAFDGLAEADRAAALEPEHLEQLGDAADLVGEDDEAVAAWTRAHTGFVGRDERRRGARVAFWISLSLLLGGKVQVCSVTR
jgi:hypothetical protein